jgi:diadenosine tetraphosphatase ApaH/serine/threonine PP2A family protein phosphatase
MRYAILSDIHGNAEALHAVFDDMDQFCDDYGGAISQVWCLGDVVGYGPEPEECVRLVRVWCDICIPGNHDWAAVGRIDLDGFGKGAIASTVWTRERLSPEDRVFLGNLPKVTHIGDFTLAHGSPSNPIWEYLTTPAVAAPNFAAFETIFCVVGHSHLPMIFLQQAGEHSGAAAPIHRAMSETIALAMQIPGGPSQSMLENLGPPTGPNEMWARCERLIPAQGLWVLPEGYRAIINPGSVGQPRDGDPRASYVIYDSELGFDFRRVRYDVAATQRRIHDLGLAAQLAARLSRGI